MRAETKSKPDSRPVNLRVPGDKRALIDRGAQVVGKNRSEFMIDAAVAAAQEAMLDQNLIVVDRATYDKFVALLDEPPAGEGFERLLQARAPWLE